MPNTNIKTIKVNNAGINTYLPDISNMNNKMKIYKKITGGATISYSTSTFYLNYYEIINVIINNVSVSDYKHKYLIRSEVDNMPFGELDNNDRISSNISYDNAPSDLDVILTVKDGQIISVYDSRDVLYRYDNGSTYYLKSNAAVKYTLNSGDVIRGNKYGDFIRISEVNTNNINTRNIENMIGLWAKISVNGVDLTRETTEEDLKRLKNSNVNVDTLTTSMNMKGLISSTDITQEAAPQYTSDEFLIEYEYDISATSTQAYVESLENSNYQLKIGNLRSIFGCPHQFLPRTDVRITAEQANSCGDISDIGRTYGEKILKNMPILYIVPGKPDFLAGFNQSQMEILTKSLLTGSSNDDVNRLLNSNGGRYYSLKFDYTSYFRYVNAMLRSAAYFLGIGDETLNGRALKDYNWMLMSDDRDNGAPVKKSEGIIQQTTKNSINKVASWIGLEGFMGQHWGTLAFYADCGDQVDDSFSNSTTQSQIASSLNSLSDHAKEIQFLVGTVGSNMGIELDELIGGGENSGLNSALEGTAKLVNNTLGQNNIVSNILSKAHTILSGGRMIFPEIWADSSFSRSYNCRLKLVSPSGDKLSVFLNILVPIYHILALTLPRQSSIGADGYFSPFLIRAYSKGLFNVDMGIITDLNITKGAEAEWTIDGIPTVAEISFTIKELYNNMSMSVWEQSSLEGSEGAGYLNILSNIAELDYIANSCGVNINEQDTWRMIKLAAALGFAGLRDKVEINIFGAINQWFDNISKKIFGIF